MFVRFVGASQLLHFNRWCSYYTDLVDSDGSIKTIEQFFCENPELRLPAVRDNGFALMHIVEQTQAICMAAVVESPRALDWVRPEFQTRELCLYALSKDPMLLEYIYPSQQTEELCVFACSLDGWAIQAVHKRTQAVCEAALKQNPAVKKLLH